MPRPSSGSCDGYSAIVTTSLPFVSAVGLHIIGDRLVGLDYLAHEYKPCGGEKPVARQFLSWLEHYLQSPDGKLPDIKLTMNGTPFQQRVWQALRGIECGRVITYGELAEQLGSGARAVAAACRANPLPLIVPCHRVVSASGIGGFMGRSGGWAIDVKRGLLQHESR